MCQHVKSFIVTPLLVEFLPSITPKAPVVPEIQGWRQKQKQKQTNKQTNTKLMATYGGRPKLMATYGGRPIEMSE